MAYTPVTPPNSVPTIDNCTAEVKIVRMWIGFSGMYDSGSVESIQGANPTTYSAPARKQLRRQLKNKIVAADYQEPITLARTGSNINMIRHFKKYVENTEGRKSKQIGPNNLLHVLNETQESVFS